MAKELSELEKFIRSYHEEYQKFYDIWHKSRLVFEGEEAVKANADIFVPKLRGQDADGYRAYIKRGLFYEASGRTLLGLVAALLGRQPNLTPPDKNNIDYFDELIIDGQPFERFLHYLCRELLAIGRIGILVDVNNMDEEVYAVSYTAENILNWKVMFIDGKPMLSDLVLSEGIHYRRVLQIVDGVYQQSLWENMNKEAKSEDEWDWQQTGATIYPMMRGQHLEEIPFYIAGLTSYAYEIIRPPLLGLVNTNLAHFRNSVDYEHGLHLTGLPTAWVAGFTTEGSDTLYIGSEKAWITEQPEAKAGFLEFTGQGLNPLRDAMTDKETLMAILGARLLSMPKNMAESAEAKRLDMLGEQSILALVASVVGELVSKVLKKKEEWAGRMSFEDIQVEIKKDFSVMTPDPQLLNSLLGLLQSGTLSYKSFFANLKKMGIIPDGLTEEEELERLEAYPLGLNEPMDNPERENPSEEDGEG